MALKINKVLQFDRSNDPAIKVTHKDLLSVKTWEQLYDFAYENGLETSKALLRLYILSGEPQRFARGIMPWEMCAAVAAAIEGLPRDKQQCPYYLDTKYGQELRDFMAKVKKEETRS